MISIWLSDVPPLLLVGKVSPSVSAHVMSPPFGHLGSHEFLQNCIEGKRRRREGVLFPKNVGCFAVYTVDALFED